MTLTKEIEHINTVPREDNSIVSINIITIYEDGKAIANNEYNIYYMPDMDIESISCSKAKALAAILWTPEVVTAYNDMIAAQEAEMNTGE